MKQRRRTKHRFKRVTQSFEDAAWDKRLQELKAYRRQFGHCQVPSRSKTHPSLGHWVSHQRVLYRAGRIKEDRKKRLEQMGFDWVSRGRSVEFRDSEYWDKMWERMFARLERFHKRHGHCRVPSALPGSPSLSGWVKRQRRLKLQGELSEARWRRLKRLGLNWAEDALDPRWEHSFQRLMEYRRRFGHCHVPAEWAEDINLGRWVVKMRRLRKAGLLSPEKAQRLDEVGFVWDAIGEREAKHDVAWSKWFAKLQAFHEQHGHWRIPTNQRRFHSLRVWMDNQRISFQRGWLAVDRVRRLNDVNFPWVSERSQQLASKAD